MARGAARMQCGAMIRSLAVALFFLLFASPAPAESCGAGAAPCRAAGGIYHVALPEGGAPRGAVIFLHGYGGTGARVLRGAWVRGALDRGYAVIAPQGEPLGENRSGGGWNSSAAAGRRDDVSFLAGVADDAAARFGIARDAMLLAGFSGGGMMTWRAACAAPARFAAYAPVSGLFWRPLPETCAGPAALLHTHGWADPVVPLEGRAVAGGRLVQGDLFAGLKLMREAFGCARDAPESYGAAGAFLIRRWTDCAPGGTLEFALHPGGHAVPAGWSALALDWFEGVEAAR
ncbi:polyhydroxybutyrate depolymerase [Pikeienuella sp. HZG-20]|uniref:alpha/beta hydrolase family esterase n=1 Tax=Paludibacillus litoralis TaxID=3133267 RepID=UPI0030ED1C53